MFPQARESFFSHHFLFSKNRKCFLNNHFAVKANYKLLMKEHTNSPMFIIVFLNLLKMKYKKDLYMFYTCDQGRMSYLTDVIVLMCDIRSCYCIYVWWFSKIIKNTFLFCIYFAAISVASSVQIYFHVLVC